LTGSPKVTEWNLSSQFNVKTQLAPGYAKGDTTLIPVSNFGAPIYGQFSFGVGNNSRENWQLFLSPMAGKSTTVLDADLRDKAAFGVEAGATWRLEAGAKITLNYNQQFSDAFSVTAKSDIFYNYWGPLSATDFMLDVIALYKIKEVFSVNAHVQLIRDIDQIDAWQRRSVLGVGLAYTIK
jgi:long-subunit fatty acid transport protein